MDTITIQQAITWGAPVAAAGVAATFALTKYSNAAAIRALEDRLRFKDDKLRDYETNPSNGSGAAVHASSLYLPAQDVADEIGDPAATDLAKRIVDLEHQRELLLSELSNRATASLDPRSELSNLLGQLQSRDGEVRSKAVEGLIALKDPFSFPALVNFLVNHPDEATSGGNPYITKWFSVLIDAGGTKGAEFVVSQIESPQREWSEAAFSTVQYALDTPELIDGAMPSLESAALRHPSTVARTKAKLLIQHLGAKKKEYEEREQERKEREQRMADLEANRSQQQELTRGQIPSNFIIVSALKDNGLAALARDLIRGGDDLRFWKSGILIAEEFACTTNNKEGCIRAIEQLLRTADAMADTSRALLLFFLSQMKTECGDASAGEPHLAEARELSAVTVDFLSSHKNAFGVRSITE